MAELKYLVRIANTDLDGKKQVMYALRKIKGIGFMLSNAICTIAGIDQQAKIGELSDQEIEKLSKTVESIAKQGMPTWLLNRRNDPETGQTYHYLGTDLFLAVDNDIKMMKKMKSYKGVRHSIGQPVRGQRTKSNFRKNKGKVKLGVTVKAPTASAPAKDGKK